MKQKTTSLMIIFLLGIIINLHAQTDSLAVSNKMTVADSTIVLHDTTVSVVNKVKPRPSSNFIKINLFGILLKNYQVQYERVITRKISFAVAFRMMPVTSIPFSNEIIKLAQIDGDTKDRIEKFRLGNFAITPEFRFYLSKKGFGRGFYVAPFYRFASFTANNIIVNYEDDLGNQSSISLGGKVTGNTGGILIGVQKTIGKHVCLDWWLLGPHYGSGSGNFSGIPDKPLSSSEQTDLRSQLNDVINSSMVTTTVNVTANSASLKLDGPFGGLRTGLSIGVRF